MTRAEATHIVRTLGYTVQPEFETYTVRLEHPHPSMESPGVMSVAEFIAYVRGFKQGVAYGYEGNSI